MNQPGTGFVGLGQMGGGMARNLAAKTRPLYGVDLSPAAGASLQDTALIFSESLAEVTRTCSRLFLCLPSAREVDAVLSGPEGIIENALPGLSIIDTSTLEREEAIGFHDRLQARGIRYADCPVSGLPSRARAGTLTLMFGGARNLFDQVRPQLEQLGECVVYCGEIGSGQAMKAVNNILYDIHIVALCELLPLAVAGGLSAEALAQVVTTASSRSFAGDHFVPRMLARQFEGDFAMEEAYKDIVNVQKIALEQKALTPLMNAMISSYQNALADGLGSEPKSAIIKVYEKALGIRFGHE